MARSGLTETLRELHAIALEARARAMPVEEVAGEREERRRRLVSRREFLKGAAVAGGAAATAAAWPGFLRPARAAVPNVVIVGAGTAGLTCAYALQKNGVPSTVYEGSPWIGGRTWTLRGFFRNGQIAEHGGEFISSEQNEARNLIKELGLTLVNTNPVPHHAKTSFFIDGAPYTYREARADWAEVIDTFHQFAWHKTPWPTRYDNVTPARTKFDNMLAQEWVERYMPGGMHTRLAKLLRVATVIEYGADWEDTNALNFYFLFGFDSKHDFLAFATNEKYHVKGGMDQMCDRLADALPGGSINTEMPLLALKDNGDGTYTCTFQDGFSTADVVADVVVLALPFTKLREVDYSLAGFSPLKDTAIQTMGMGKNSKLHLQFDRRVWLDQGLSGYTYSDTGYQDTWEVTNGFPGKPGILVDYTGGMVGGGYDFPEVHGPAPALIARRFLRQLEPVIPGISRHWNGKAYLDYWKASEWSWGSYSYWRPGQYTQFAGYEKVREGNVFFCGEHTSVNAQGYINGAVMTGRDAARNIVEAFA